MRGSASWAPLGAIAATVLLAGCDGGRHSSVVPDAGAPSPRDTCGARSACGPARDDFFTASRLAEIRLTFDPADLEASRALLRSEGHSEPLDTWLDVLWGRWSHCGPYKDRLVPVTMQYRMADGDGDVVMRRVGIRLRGTMSRGRFPLPGMKLYFDAVPENAGNDERRTFAGSDRLNLLSVEDDDTLMTQCLTYRLMRDFDLPAPRCNHVAVFVDGAYYGLMQNVDEVDEHPFLAQAFGDAVADGSLYKCSGGCGYDDSFATLEYRGDRFTDYRVPQAYEPIRPQVNAPEHELIPMLKCGDPVATPDDAAFSACINGWLDVPEWLRLIAAETLTPVLESFVGALTNYYLYFKPEPGSPHGGRFNVYSWDYDAALLRASCYPATCDPLTAVAGWFGPGGQRAQLVTRLTRVFRADYCAAMNAFLRDVYRPELVDDTANVLDATMTAQPVPYQPTFDRSAQRPVARPPLTHEAWLAKVAEMRAFMVTHRAEAQAAVDAACAAP